jgi:hypothetical protein
LDRDVGLDKVPTRSSFAWGVPCPKGIFTVDIRVITVSRAHRRFSARRRLPAPATVIVVVALLVLTGAAAKDAWAMPTAYGPVLPRSLVDRPDDFRRKAQIHVMYVLPSDRADRALDTDGTLKNTVSSFENWLAGKTRGRALRIDAFQGSIDITFLHLNQTDAQMASYGAFVRDQIEAEMKAAGFNAPHKIYAVYYDGTSNTACGGGAWPPTLPGTVAALTSTACRTVPYPAQPTSSPVRTDRRPILSSQCCTSSCIPLDLSRRVLPINGEEGMFQTIRTI